MADDTTVIIDINVEDNSSSSIENITNNVVHLHQAVQREEKQNDRWSESLKRMAKAAGTAVKAVAKMAASVAAVASAAGPAVSGLLAAGKAIGVFASAGARLAPLAAFLPAIAGGVGLISTTLKLAGPGLARAFKPITDEAARLAKTLQRVVGIDVKPAAQAFVKLNMPAIGQAMERIAYQTNLIVAGTLKWANSVQGVAAIKAISKGAADMFERLTPHVIATVSAFGNLAGRAADPAFKWLGDMIGRILDKLAAWADNTSVEDINGALKDLAGYGVKLRQVFGVIRDVGRWLAENQGAVKKFSDVAAGAAITLGVATGNIPAVVAGAVSLIINHWSQLKAPFTDAIGWVKRMATAWQNDAGRIAIADSIMNGLRTMKTAFDEAVTNIGPKWRKFVAEIKAAWLEWAPLIKTWWDTGGKATFEMAGAALGMFVNHLVEVATAVTIFVRGVAAGFKWLVGVVLDVLGAVINGAAKAFGWMGSIGGQLKTAAAEFNAFKDRVNKALDSIDTLKTIRINANVYVTGGGSAAGGVDQRTGNSRNAGLSGLTSWQRVAAALGGGGDRGGGTSRTGGPVHVHSEHSISVSLDGQPFRRVIARAVNESEARTAWLNWNGRR